jgi:hypothetical protein
MSVAALKAIDAEELAAMFYGLLADGVVNGQGTTDGTAC